VSDELADHTNLTLRQKQIIEKLRIACGKQASGKMRNVAPPFTQAQLMPWNESMTPWDRNNVTDIWCGYLPQAYLDYWPNVAQLIIFTVFQNTGTTISLAWQGVVGTGFACANMAIMTWLYPFGALGHLCNAGRGLRAYTVIWHSAFRFHSRSTNNLVSAQLLYNRADRRGGLDARAIYGTDGEMITGWFLNDHLEEMTQAEFHELKGEDCTPGTYVHDDEYYNQWVCLLNVMAVLFLFLASRAERNTIMFGMSWHICFMMDFMNPEIGNTQTLNKKSISRGAMWITSGFTAVLRTTVVGAVVAVAAVMTCSLFLPVNNLRNLYEDSLALTQAITSIWHSSVAYLAGSQRSAKRFQIETCIDGLENIVSKTNQNANGAWWETLDQGPCGRTRRLLVEYDASSSDIMDMLYAVKGCVLSENFAGEHGVFCQVTRVPMEALTQTAEDCMFLCIAACRDGVIDEEEAAAMLQKAEDVKAKQREFLEAFHRASPSLSQDLAEENIFAFSLSFWARKVTDMAERTAEFCKGHRKRCCATIASNAYAGLVATWSPRRMFEREHREFALLNLISIGVCFLMSYFMPSGSIFVQYSSVMPSTLSLLIGGDGPHQIGSMMKKNTHRLLGVVLGKVLPFVATWVLFYTPCFSNLRFFAQMILLWIYIFTFTYIYYASPFWGYVGCLIAGFGCYQLLLPCSGDPSSTFQTRYQEIGSVTVAIFMQMFVHALLSKHSPSELQVELVRDLGEAFKAGFAAFFESNLPGMQAAARTAAEKLAAAKTMLPECDPAMRLIPCGEEAFPMDLCSSALTTFQRVLSDLNLLIVAVKDWVPNEQVRGAEGQEAEAEAGSDVPKLLEVMNQRPAMQSVRDQLMRSITVSTHLLLAALDPTDDGTLDEIDVTMRDLHVHPHLMAGEDLYKQLSAVVECHNVARDADELTNDIRTRLTIAVRALETSAQHVARLEERCLKEAC